MKKSPHHPSNDLRGISHLTIDAITGITDLVEAMHHTINTLGTASGERTHGLTGMVYNNIRTVSHLAGHGLDSLLKQFNALTLEIDSGSMREALLAAFNGVLGDHLVAQKNLLAIPMQLRQNGQPLSMNTKTRATKVVIMIHGLCTNDLQWERQGHNHGTALARDLGYLPIYLHYNSGRHISENGRSFADLIENFMQSLDSVTELNFIGHSMGGLVARSAIYYGELAGHDWVRHLDKLIFLGVPHHGAPWERGGNWIDVLLQIRPYSAPFARLGKIRSAGITDLRYGNILDQDWQGRCRFEHSGDHRHPVSLPENIECYTIAATLSKKAGKLSDGLLGDGLVPLDSALGQHQNDRFKLLFPEENQVVIRDINHLDLLNHPEVYQTIMQWL